MWVKRDAKYEEKLTLGFKNFIENSVNFTGPVKGLKIWYSIFAFCPKNALPQLKLCGWVMCHCSQKWCKIWSLKD